MKLLKTVGLTLGTAAALYFLFVISVILTPYINNYSARIDFDSEKWKDWEESETNMSLRWNMIADFEENYKLEGMTAKEVMGLLGEPDGKSDIEWTYYLGVAGHGIDTGTLAITFEDGRVKSHRTYRS